MSDRQFKVKRIDTPSWGEAPSLDVVNLTKTEFRQIQRRRAQLLETVQEEVESYCNDDRLVGMEEDDFPCLLKLTGEYYLARELYQKFYEGKQAFYFIGIKTRFLQKPWYEGQDEFDYLGLDVWVRFNPETWDFFICRNTDSQVI